MKPANVVVVVDDKYSFPHELGVLHETRRGRAQLWQLA